MCTFWTSTIGVVLYAVSMWISGITQGLMWRAFNDDGTLTYSFIETVKFTYPYYGIRLLGGIVFFAGMIVMVYNVYRTIAERSKPATDQAVIPARLTNTQASRHETRQRLKRVST